MARPKWARSASRPRKGAARSSTMPQKSNPITSELIVSAARMNARCSRRCTTRRFRNMSAAPRLAVGRAGAAADVHANGGALKHAVYLAKNLASRRRRDAGNYSRANDVILAEAAVFALAQALPRLQAEELVKKACVVAVAENKSLIDIVKQLAGDSAMAINWQALARPDNYLGESDKIIDRVLALARKHF